MAAQYLQLIIGHLRHALTDGSDEAVARRSAAAALIIRLLSAVIAYAAQVVLARLMGQHEYGVFAFTWVWLMIVSVVFSLGLGEVPVRLVPELRARGEMALLRGFMRFAPIVAAAASATAGIVIVLGLHFSSHWVEDPYFIPMMVMLIAAPVVCVSSFLEGFGRTQGWVLPALIPNFIMRHGLLLVVMVAAVMLGLPATAVTAFGCLVVTVVVSLLVQFAWMRPRLPSAIPPGPRAYRPREWLAASTPFAVLHGSTYLFSFADVMVLFFFVSPAEIAVYFAATRIIQVINLIPFAASVGTAHLFSDAHARGARGEMQRMAHQVCLLAFATAAAGAAGIAFTGYWLLAMFGQSFNDGYLPLLILALGVIAHMVSGPAEDLLNMSGLGRVAATTSTIAVVASLMLNALLIPAFGIEGAAVATSVAVAGRAAWMALEVRRRLGISTFLWSAIHALLRQRVFGGAGRAAFYPAE